jgi:hypothetical protein
MSTNNLSKIIMLGLTGVVIILGILIFLAPPALFVDAADGFRTLRSMEMGNGFNQLVTPNADDLTKNSTEFLTWWSPGQYLVPYVFKLIFGINTGRATALAITLFQLLGLWGFYKFFKKMGFSSTIAAVSMLVIACQRFFILPYVYYYGGELLLFGFLGWFLYGCVSFNRPGLLMAVFILASGLLGFFCKSSIMWMFLAGLLFLWIRLSSKKPTSNWIKNGLWVGIPAIVAVAIIWLCFLSKGQNPVSISDGIKFTLKAFAFPLASPLLAGFSVDDICNGLIYHIDKPVFSDTSALILISALALISVWLIWQILKKVPDWNYRLFLRVFYLGSLAFFTFVYLRQMPISYEARHFRIIGLIVVPGIVYLLSKSAAVYRAAFLIIVVGIAVTSVIYAVKGYTYNKNESAHGVSGFAERGIDQKALNQVMALDKKNTNAIFVFVSESMPLEIKHNRVIVLPPIGDDLKIEYDDYEQGGHAGPLFIILPEKYAGPKEKMILKAFPDYKGWYGSMLSDNTVMYAAK